MVVTVQVCISFLLRQGMIVIAKSVSPKRIRENLKASRVHLDADDMERIKAIDKNYMLFKVSQC